MDTHAFETRCLHTKGEKINRSIINPIFQNVSFVLPPNFTSFSEVIYPRLHNLPNVAALSKKISDLEGAEETILLASGMAAVTCAITALVRAGESIVMQSSVYGGTASFADYLSAHNIAVTTFNPWDYNTLEDLLNQTVYFNNDEDRPISLRKAIKDCRLVFIEGLSNPIIRLAAIDLVAEAVRTLNEENEANLFKDNISEIINNGKDETENKRNILTMIDNTVLSPYILQPIKQFGIDVVIHSATKYLSGHGDIICGVVCCKKSEVMKPIFQYSGLTGACLDAHAAFLLERGLRTLPIRCNRHSETTLKIAKFLNSHPKVRTVNYPGLFDHPDFERAKRMLKNEFLFFNEDDKKISNEEIDEDNQIVVKKAYKLPLCNGLISFTLLNDSTDVAVALASSFKLFAYTGSLGSTESLSIVPAKASHAKMSAKKKAEAKIEDGLIRLSIGLEDAEDLIKDLEDSLKSVP